MNKITQRMGVLYDMLRLDLSSAAKTNNKHILLACMPKTGSTFLSTIIESLPGFKHVGLTSSCGRNEQELDYLYLIINNRINYIAQQHVRYSDLLENQMNRFNIQAVVLVRNIFDCVVSMKDHYRRESVIHSMAYADSKMLDWNDSKLECFIASMVVPWYLNFYLSWLACDHRLLINYKEILEDPVNTATKVLDFSGINMKENDIITAVKSASIKNTRKNKAIEGRGQSLTPEAKEKILELASYYSAYDLSPIGL